MNFGKEHKLETLKDEVGNVVIRKPATKGMEKKEERLPANSYGYGLREEQR